MAPTPRPLLRLGWATLLWLASALLSPVLAGPAEKAEPPAAPPKIPKPAVIDGGRYRLIRDGKVVGIERFKMVRSRHSGTFFASGVQKRFKRPRTVERYEAMDPKKRRRLKVVRKQAHHFELSPEGKLIKYKTWTRTKEGRLYVLLAPRDEGMTRRVERLNRVRSKRLGTAPGTLPFRADSVFLVRMALRRIGKSGGKLPVVETIGATLGTLSVTRIEGGGLVLGDAGKGGRVDLDEHGRILRYILGGLTYEREGS